MVTHSLDQPVFLVDEGEVVRDSLKVLLESHGVQVQDFRDAAEFMAKANTARGGCLVLGYNRLIVDGLELRTPDKPILLVGVNPRAAPIVRIWCPHSAHNLPTVTVTSSDL